ncbi:uncharacterized protein LOC143907468 [Temnothorax americanus]|uniref:uncharacterized protein LOC143907468 n=1 Tax=Temnothorax americanus TaxID=1964332 RepID=UPI004067C4F2
MADILNIGGEPIFDDSVVKIETHTYNPYANTTFGHNDEIRIPIQQQDLYTLSCESFLYVEGRLVIKRRNDVSVTTLANNCVAFMFDEIRYELNGVEIDRNRNVGITSTIKNYVSLSYNDSQLMRNAGWDVTSSIPEGYFNFCVPLNDNNCIVGNPATEPEIELFKIQWRMPHVTLNEVNKLSILQALESGRNLSVSFRSWDLYEYPMLQTTTKHSWAVKTATQLEKPQYVIFALQTGRKNIMSQNVSVFDACIQRSVKMDFKELQFEVHDMKVEANDEEMEVPEEMDIEVNELEHEHEIIDDDDDDDDDAILSDDSCYDSERFEDVLEFALFVIDSAT